MKRGETITTEQILKEEIHFARKALKYWEVKLLTYPDTPANAIDRDRCKEEINQWRTLLDKKLNV